MKRTKKLNQKFKTSKFIDHNVTVPLYVINSKMQINIYSISKKFHIYRKTFSLDNACNNGCGCSRSEFSPICGVDGITYYSPCHAGCYQGMRLNNVEVSISYRT